MLVVLALTGNGCWPGGGQAPGPAVSPVASRAPAVMRLTQIYWEQQQRAQREPLTIPMDDAWVAPDAIVRTRGSSLIVAPPPRPVTLVRGVQGPAHLYNQCRVRMRVERGEDTTFGWQTNLTGLPADSYAVEIPLIPDGDFHTYVFPLTPDAAGSWAGNIEAIWLRPSDAASSAEIASVELAFVPSETPPRITLAGDNREAISLPAFDWRFEVPHNAALDFAVGLRPIVWERNLGAVRMVASLYDRGTGANAPERRVLTQVLAPSSNEAHRTWQPVHFDLSAYAGRDVTIRFAAQAERPGGEAAAVWANPRVRERRNDPEAVPLILISCDTLRADRLGCYGYDRPTTPHLDAFAKEAVQFTHAIAPVPWTPASHMTMLTGLYPKNHGVDHTTALDGAIPTVAERLGKERGYLAAGITGHNWWLQPYFGFARGMDVYVTPREEEKSFRSILLTRPMAEDWLQAHGDGRVFLFFHNYDIHTKLPGSGYPAPYWPADDRYLHFSKALGPPPDFSHPALPEDSGHELLIKASVGEIEVTEEQRVYLEALYDDGVRMVDDQLGQFFAALKAMGLYDRAMIVVTSDHGEEFCEHGKYMHAQLYDENLRVPLLVRFPHGERGGEIFQQQVPLASIYATLLEAAGISDTGVVDAPSLQSLLDGRNAAPEHAFARYTTYDSLYAVRTPSQKLIYQSEDERFELYDLLADPGETKNLWAGQRGEPPLWPVLSEFSFARRHGWRLRLVGSGDPRPFQLRLFPEGEGARARLHRAEPLGEARDLLEMAEDGSIEVSLHTWDGDHDDILIRDMAEDAPMRMIVETPGPWELAQFGGVTPFDGDADTTLHTGEALPGVADQLNKGSVPRLYVFYFDQANAGPAVAPLSETAKDELEALGYL